MLIGLLLRLDTLDFRMFAALRKACQIQNEIMKLIWDKKNQNCRPTPCSLRIGNTSPTSFLDLFQSWPMADG